MELYLIRHGLAAERGTASEELRPLTEEGRQKTRKIADRLNGLKLRFDLVLTSPLLRARQTAEILLQAGLTETLEVSMPLQPGGDLLLWLSEWVARTQAAHSPLQRLAIVGHEPDLSQWAEQLVWGEIFDRLILKKAGIIGLTFPEQAIGIAQGQLFWLTPPRLFL